MFAGLLTGAAASSQGMTNWNDQQNRLTADDQANQLRQTQLDQAKLDAQNQTKMAAAIRQTTQTDPDGYAGINGYPVLGAPTTPTADPSSGTYTVPGGDQGLHSRLVPDGLTGDTGRLQLFSTLQGRDRERTARDLRQFNAGATPGTFNANAAPAAPNAAVGNAVRQVESGNNANAVSPKGAVGTMQTMPTTLTNPGFGVTPAKDNSPAEQERVGRDYLGAMQQRYGDLNTALMAYNWGPGNVDKWIAGGKNPAEVPAETQAYVPKVLAALNQGGGVSVLGPPAAQPTAQATAQPAAARYEGPLPQIPEDHQLAYQDNERNKALAAAHQVLNTVDPRTPMGYQAIVAAKAQIDTLNLQKFDTQTLRLAHLAGTDEHSLSMLMQVFKREAGFRGDVRRVGNGQYVLVGDDGKQIGEPTTASDIASQVYRNISPIIMAREQEIDLAQRKAYAESHGKSEGEKDAKIAEANTRGQWEYNKEVAGKTIEGQQSNAPVWNPTTGTSAITSTKNGSVGIINIPQQADPITGLKPTYAPVNTRSTNATEQRVLGLAR